MAFARRGSALAMRIAKVEAMVVKAPVEGISTWRAASFKVPFRYAEATLVRVETDEGLTGWGEVHAPVAPEVSAAVVRELLAPALIGESIKRPAALWDKLYGLMRARGHYTGFTMEAISGVDIALWDLFGKAAGEPVHALLGGAHRTEVPVYASVMQWLDPAEAVARIRAFADDGFRAMKLKVGEGYREDLARIEAAGAAAPEGFWLMADANCRFTLAEAKRLAIALDKNGFQWLEEPVPPEDVCGYAELRRVASIRIAGGECECTHYRFAELFRQGALDVAQPDICRAGGLTACQRIGVIADAHNLQIAPHVSIGTAIHLIASAHWAAASSNLLIHEYPVFRNPLVDDLLARPPLVVEGYLQVPTGAGLGIEVRTEVLDRYRVS
jgi:L-alanine-DL-glutamate epimerase-like enolase superfamily enzyme